MEGGWMTSYLLGEGSILVYWRVFRTQFGWQSSLRMGQWSDSCVHSAGEWYSHENGMKFPDGWWKRWPSYLRMNYFSFEYHHCRSILQLVEYQNIKWVFPIFSYYPLEHESRLACGPICGKGSACSQHSRHWQNLHVNINVFPYCYVSLLQGIPTGK